MNEHDHALAGVEIFARDGVPIARVRGEIDLSNVGSIGSAIEQAIDPEARGLIVELSNVDYLDSAGVRLLFRLAQDVQHAGGTLLAVVPAAAGIRRVLELAGIEQAVQLDETEDAALVRLNGRLGVS